MNQVKRKYRKKIALREIMEDFQTQYNYYLAKNRVWGLKRLRLFFKLVFQKIA